MIGIRLTNEEFIERSKNIYGRDSYDYSLVNYVNTKSKVKIICKKHGMFEVIPANHLGKKKVGCFKCKGLVRCLDDFIEKAKVVHNYKYDYSTSLYKNSKTKISIICPIHGRFLQSPGDHLAGKGCRECGILSRSNKQRKTLEQFIEDSTSLHGNKYDYSLVKYKTAHIKVKIICEKHGIFKQTPHSHINGGQGCPSCGLEARQKIHSFTTDQFIQRAIEIHNDLYDYSLVNYVNMHTKTKIICRDHGLFRQTPNVHIFNKAGCPLCYKESSRSKGEVEVGRVLSKNNIIFKEQKTFSSCQDKKPLRFDFYLPDKNILIEYQGQQHYESVSFWGGEKNLEQQQARDQIKRDWCKENNYKLIEIPYWKYESMEKIIRKEVLNF